jgi:RNA-directed DNA polymerase
LKTIGLELEPLKTRISYTLKSLNGTKPGFDFLGFTVRQYPTKQNKKSYKLRIKPSLSSIKQHALAIKHRLREMLEVPQDVIIRELNPIIRDGHFLDIQIKEILDKGEIL